MTTIAPAMEITVPAGMAVIVPIPAAPTECAPVSTTITAREMATVPTKVIVPVTIWATVPVIAIVPPMWLPRRDLTVPPAFVARFRDPSLRLPDGVRVPEYLSSTESSV